MSGALGPRGFGLVDPGPVGVGLVGPAAAGPAGAGLLRVGLVGPVTLGLVGVGRAGAVPTGSSKGGAAGLAVGVEVMLRSMRAGHGLGLAQSWQTPCKSHRLAATAVELRGIWQIGPVKTSPPTWVERDRAVVWHGFTQMSTYADSMPITVERAEGHYLIDVDGRRYLDAISSLWVNTLGHRVPELDRAIIDQLGRVAHSTMLGNGNRAVVELAEALAQVVPVVGPHFLFASDGAAALEQALKIAFQYWVNRGEKRTSYLAFGRAYHGDTVGSLSLGASGFGTDMFDPLRFPVLRAPAFDADPELAQACALIGAHRGSLAAVVVEPLVQGAGGMRMAPPDSFRRLAEVCATNDVLLIADEVATGFGRTGTLFASEQCHITPDLLCLGKGITGGYLPMSVTVAADRVFETFLGPGGGASHTATPTAATRWRPRWRCATSSS